MDQKLVGAIIGLGVFILIVATSGVLLWAIVISAMVGVGTFALTREFQAAFLISGVAFFAVSAYGIATMISPGWYIGIL